MNGQVNLSESALSHHSSDLVELTRGHWGIIGLFECYPHSSGYFNVFPCSRTQIRV